MKTRLWILTNTPSPYQLDFFRAIHQSGRFDLSVRFMRTTHRGTHPLSGIEAGFPFRELRGIGPLSWRDEIRLHPSALREVRAGDSDFFLLSGHYTSATFLACAALLRRGTKPWAVWLERPWPDAYRPAWATRPSARHEGLRKLRHRVLTRLLNAAPGVFCIGTAAMDAYRALGATGDKLHLLPYFCDLGRFGTPGAENVAEIRRRFGLDGQTVFLFSGQLIERKGPDLVLAAFERIGAARPRTSLVVLGDGSLRKTLESSVPPALRGRVHFAGLVPQEHLPAFFAAAHVFVFPSRHDGWGVVINEACGAGLPIVATDSVGAARDLVEHGKNGFVIPRDYLEQLVEKMDFFVQNPEAVAAFGRHSREVGRRYDLDHGVEMLQHCIRAVSEKRKSV